MSGRPSRRILSVASLTGRDGRAVRVGGVIATVTEPALPELLPLMRGYSEFYEVSPADDALLALARNLIEHPDEGLQLIARTDDGEAVGFATVYWTWQTLNASRLGVMNDLFVAEEARGTGLADRLIAAWRERCAIHAGAEVAWRH